MTKIMLLILMLCFNGAGGAAGSPDVLIAHYKMNDNTDSNTVVDSTGNHNGTFKDATGDPNTDAHDASGKINGALDFDGTDDYIEIADHDDFTFSTGTADKGFSVTQCVYVVAHTVVQQIASKRETGSVGEWDVAIDHKERPRLELVDETNGGNVSARTDVALSEGWHFIVFTYDGRGGIAAGEGVRIYVDDVEDTNLVTNPDASYACMSNTDTVLSIGRSSSGSAYMQGKIDNVMIFGTDLSPSEVQILYNNGAATEIPAELNEQINPRRHNLSPLPLRRRY